MSEEELAQFPPEQRECLKKLQQAVIDGDIDLAKEAAEEALKFFAGCREEDLRGRERYLEDLEARTEKYIRSCERVFGELRVSSLPRSIDEEGVREILRYAEMYLRDAKYYLEEGRRASALSSVSYCEGILDALRMLRFVEFDW